MSTLKDSAASQADYYGVESRSSLTRIVRGEGIRLFDDHGRELIDVASGAFLANLGQGNQRVLQAMLDQGRRLTYSYIRNTRHDANELAASKLTALAGPGFECAHFASGGSEAVENAIKIARLHAIGRGEPQRRRIVTLMPSYHGSTLGTIGMTGDRASPQTFDEMTAFSLKIPAPLTYRAASPSDAADRSITALMTTLAEVGAETVLAILVEPIGGQSSGVNVPHPSFLRSLRRICDEHRITLVFDEICTAFRTGELLAARHDPDALPDMAVLSKGLGGGYVPAGAVLTSAAFTSELASFGGYQVSQSLDANPIASAAVAALLDEVAERGLIAHAAAVGDRILRGLKEVARRSPIVGDVRGRGLFIGVEFVADKATKERFTERDPAECVRRHGLDHGLLVYTRRQNNGMYGDWIVVAPPLVTTFSEADVLVERLDATIAASARELGRAQSARA